MAKVLGAVATAGTTTFYAIRAGQMGKTMFDFLQYSKNGLGEVWSEIQDARTGEADPQEQWVSVDTQIQGSKGGLKEWRKLKWIPDATELAGASSLPPLTDEMLAEKYSLEELNGACAWFANIAENCRALRTVNPFLDKYPQHTFPEHMSMCCRRNVVDLNFLGKWRTTGCTANEETAEATAVKIAADQEPTLKPHFGAVGTLTSSPGMHRITTFLQSLDEETGIISPDHFAFTRRQQCLDGFVRDGKEPKKWQRGVAVVGSFFRGSFGFLKKVVTGKKGMAAGALGVGIIGMKLAGNVTSFFRKFAGYVPAEGHHSRYAVSSSSEEVVLVEKSCVGERFVCGS